MNSATTQLPVRSAPNDDIEPVLSFYRNYQSAHPDYAEKVSETYRRLAKFALPLQPLQWFHRPTRAEFVFAGNIGYFSHLTEFVPPEDSLYLVTGLRTWLSFTRRQIPAALSTGLYYPLPALLAGQKHGRVAVQRKISQLADHFRSIRAEFLLVQSDSMPLERLLVVAARKAGMTTVCVQHGIFSRGTRDSLVEGRFADLFIAYDRPQAILVRGDGPDSGGIVGGSLSRNVPKLPRKGRRAVCFFGQPYPLLLKQTSEAYVALINRLANVCAAKGYEFLYKPHPGENGATYLTQLPAVTFGETAEFYERFDYFMAVSSTTLHQASLMGKVAIQIIDEAIHTDRFSDYGYSHSVTEQEFAQMLSRLEELPALTSDALAVYNEGDLGRRWANVACAIRRFRKAARRNGSIRVADPTVAK